jgi:large subunit ribosomal protein L7/L12
MEHLLMKPRNFLWAYLFGFVLTVFCGNQIAYRVFGLSSHVAVPIFLGYSFGLVLMSIGSVSQFWTRRIEALEEKIAGLAVTAAAPLALPAGQTEFTVTLKKYAADKKIGLIKVIREATGLGLKEAKDLVEGVPSIVKARVSKADLEVIMKKLAETGAEVEIN